MSDQPQYGERIEPQAATEPPPEKEKESITVGLVVGTIVTVAAGAASVALASLIVVGVIAAWKAVLS